MGKAEREWGSEPWRGAAVGRRGMACLRGKLERRGTAGIEGVGEAGPLVHRIRVWGGYLTMYLSRRHVARSRDAVEGCSVFSGHGGVIWHRAQGIGFRLLGRSWALASSGGVAGVFEAWWGRRGCDYALWNAWDGGQWEKQGAGVRAGQARGLKCWGLGAWIEVDWRVCEDEAVESEQDDGGVLFTMWENLGNAQLPAEA
ncbi:hypothetical protein F5887DRAFT_922176 [Amanita rubescens]|nr:hypothetical protein F5887DRAFT_922176 [Amanita rubescens]